MKRRIAIVGGGACGLMLAARLASDRLQVDLYERNATPGRKFLVAGDGGFNLTHSESPEDFIRRYTPPHFLQNCFQKHNNAGFRAWLSELGIPTFVGSSGRVFPEKGIKPIQVINAIFSRASRNGVRFHFDHAWTGFTDKNTLQFISGNSEVLAEADFVVFCLGGASWPVTGSKGDWPGYFEKKGITVADFYPSNCEYYVTLANGFYGQHKGRPLKNIELFCDDVSQKGELTVTAHGFEGNAIYALSPRIRRQLLAGGQARVELDLKPDLDQEEIHLRLRKKNAVTGRILASDLKLSVTAIALLKHSTTKEEFMHPQILSALIKKLPLKVIGPGPLQDAISSVGGVHPEEVDENFGLKKMPGFFVIGEMLDYDAPTGGYLLQSCYSMASGLSDNLHAL